MNEIKYLITKLLYLLCGRNCEVMNNFFRKCGITIGENTHIFSNISSGEGYLITIGNNVTISNNVSFITHDASVKHFIPHATDVFGKIKIGDNCFVGMNTTILPGVEIVENCIIGAGSIVSKSIRESGTVWAGNPAKEICKLEDLREKYKDYVVDLTKYKDKKNAIKSAKMIVR